MKTKKLKLNDLQVKSFITELESKQEKTVKGGSGMSINCSPYLVRETPVPEYTQSPWLCTNPGFCLESLGCSGIKPGGCSDPPNCMFTIVCYHGDNKF
jgi:hypothetical protein